MTGKWLHSCKTPGAIGRFIRRANQGDMWKCRCDQIWVLARFTPPVLGAPSWLEWGKVNDDQDDDYEITDAHSDTDVSDQDTGPTIGFRVNPNGGA